MAKLKAPLMSLGASQQLGKALVFFPWKGLNVVREYVIPSNPRTTLQTTQRGYMKSAVALIHAAMGLPEPLAETDTMAYGLWAGVVQPATTWFNQAVKQDITRRRAILTPVVFRAGSTTPGADKLDVEVRSHAAAPTTAHFVYGTRKTALIHTKAATVVGTKMSASIAGLETGVKYYWQVVIDTAATLAGNRSGIYYGYPT